MDRAGICGVLSGNLVEVSPSLELEVSIRTAAFAALKELVSRHGPDLRWEVIERGFHWRNEHILFANRARGIFKPKRLGVALSVKTTVPREGRSRRYDDLAGDEVFQYRYQGDQPGHHDNLALKQAFHQRLPIIYFYGLAPGVYRPLWPAYVTGINDQGLSCEIAFSAQDEFLVPGRYAADPRALSIERRYVTVEVKKRLHQDAFRHQVLTAYDDRCAVCRLPRRELLEASHIIPDRDVRGRPEVPNGLALCRLHHGAFDTDLLGIQPDGVIVISKHLLDAHDGPTLEHGLKGFNGKKLEGPRNPEARPRPEYLEERYARFRRAG